MRVKKRHIAVFIIPTLLLFALIFGIALVSLGVTSFGDWGIGRPLTFTGVDNYVRMFTKDSNFSKALGNTLIWILMQSVVHVGIGVVLALILLQREFYWKFVRTVFMIPNIISGGAMGMLFICILNPGHGAVNSLLKLMGLGALGRNWFMDYSTAFSAVTLTWLLFAGQITILVLAEATSISDSVLESARIDGANPLQINLHIVLPHLRNIIATSVIIAGTSMLQKLDIIMMTTGGGPGNETLNIPVHLYNSLMLGNDFGYANALGSVLIVVGIVFVLVAQTIFGMGRRDAV